METGPVAQPGALCDASSMQSVHRLSSKPPQNPSGPTPGAYLEADCSTLTSWSRPPSSCTNYSLLPSTLNLSKVHTHEHRMHIRVSTCSLGGGVGEGRAVIKKPASFSPEYDLCTAQVRSCTALQWLPTLLGATGRASQRPPARPLRPLTSLRASLLLRFLHRGSFLPQGLGTCCSCPPLRVSTTFLS